MNGPSLCGKVSAVFLFLVLAGFSCTRGGERSSPRSQGGTVAHREESLQLRSPAFPPGGPIPSRYTCDGENLSPPLRWSSPPPQAASLALICDDPDAPRGRWIHWVLFGLPPQADSLAEGAAGGGQLPQGARQGRNDFGELGYGGPCPPPGPAHRYFFHLYALDTLLALPPGLRAQELEKAMEGHLVATGQLMGTYARKR